MAIEDSIVGAESGGDPNARNPNSSASGPGQFIDSTWIDTVTRHRPDLASMAPADILALKSDPVLSKEMTAAYAADNAGILSKAGVPVTPGTTYLAHFAGPGGAVGLLNADPSTPAVSILGERVIKANPFLAGKTAGDVAAWADRKMGGAGTPTGATSIGAPMALAPPPAAPAQQPTAAAQPSYAAAPAAAPNFDQVPAPLALLPPRPRIDLRTTYANLRRG